MELATAFVTIRPQSDGFEAELGQMLSGIEDVEVPVSAETSEAEADLAGLSEEELSLLVEADITPAEAALAELPDAEEIDVTINPEGIEETKEQVEELTDSTSKLSDVAEGAVGGMAGLGGAAGGAVKALGPSGGVFGVAAAAIGALTLQGVEASSALERFNLIAGDMAGSLRSIDVGGLSGDIGDLALSIGSSDEAMLQATASFVTFAESSGLNRRQIVQTSDQINALALRAAALNPALGDAGAVAERLVGALARGGRPLRAFGLDIQSAEIKARAAEMGLADANGEIGQTELAAAGASIAVEQLGDKLGSDFTEGAKNSELRMRALKEQVGELGEQLGTAAVPALGAFADALTPLISDLGKAAAATDNFWSSTMALGESLDDPGWRGQLADFLLTGVAGGFSEASREIHGTAEVSDEVIAALGGTTEAAQQAAQAVTDLSEAIDQYLTGLFSVPDAQREARQAISELAEANTQGTWDDQAQAMEGVVTTAAQVVQAMQAQGASQHELDAAIFGSISSLATMRDQGRITGHQFDLLSGQIRDVPHESVTPVSAPNAEETRDRVREVDSSVRHTPTNWPININAQVNRSAFDQLIRDLDAADNRRFAMQVSVNRTEAFGIDRPINPGGTTVTHVTQVHVDGNMLAEVVDDRLRVRDIGLGYDQ